MTNQDRASNLPELPEPQAWKYWHKVDSTKVATVSVRMDSAIKGADEYAEIPLFDADQMREYGRLCAATPASPAVVTPVRAVEQQPVAWWRWSYIDEQGNADADVQMGENMPTASVLPDNGFPWQPLYGAPLATPAQAAQGGAEPVQPLVTDSHGVLRFKENRIVSALLENSRKHGYGLNETARGDFTPDEHMQVAQLIGYSLDGYGTLSYVTDEAYDRAARSLAAPSQAAAVEPAQAAPAAAVPEAVERDAARLDWIIRQGDEFTCAIVVDAPGDGDYLCTGMTTVGQGKTAREAIDAAMGIDRLAAKPTGKEQSS